MANVWRVAGTPSILIPIGNADITAERAVKIPTITIVSMDTACFGSVVTFSVNYYFQNRLTFKIKTDLDATVDSHKNTGIIYDIIIQNVKEAEL